MDAFLGGLFFMNPNKIIFFILDSIDKKRKIIIYKKTKNIGETNYLCEIFIENEFEIRKYL